MTNQRAIEVLHRMWHDWKLNNKLYNMPDTEHLDAIQLGISALKTEDDMWKGGKNDIIND